MPKIMKQNMAKKIKLIWDIRSAEAQHMAEHHLVHLKEYAQTNSLELLDAGTKVITDMHCIAFMVVHEKDMITVRDALKPHRGELVL